VSFFAVDVRKITSGDGGCRGVAVMENDQKGAAPVMVDAGFSQSTRVLTVAVTVRVFYALMTPILDMLARGLGAKPARVVH
jgi:hypothetical protein